MEKVYHFLAQVIDFVFPYERTLADTQTLPANTGYLGENITALFSYQDEKVKEIVWQIKYYRNERAAKRIALALYEKLLTLNLPTPFILLPIPMSDASRKQRGYNQTEFMAEKLFSLFDSSICSGISLDLKKIHTSRPQHTLERSERIENTKNMFYISQKNCFENKNIIILDDVITTGSTLKEAARLVRVNGANTIWAITIAH